MRTLLFLLTIVIAAGSCKQAGRGELRDDLVPVKGGVRKGMRLPDFAIGRYEVTQKEWTEVVGSNPSAFKGENLPVETVSWYDCVDYCNKRSIKEGLSPCYTIDKEQKDPNNTNELDDVKWIVTLNRGANGYRLPTEAEWEYAAVGGQQSKGSLYSGSNQLDEVAWYWKNAGDRYLTEAWSWPLLVKNHNKTKPVGSRAPNELGLYDMSGNVREWCWDVEEGHGSGADRGSGEPQRRIWKGGGWMGADFCCEPSFRAGYEANGKGPDQGFRLCRGGSQPAK